MEITQQEKAEIAFQRMVKINKVGAISYREKAMWVAGYVSALNKG